MNKVLDVLRSREHRHVVYIAILTLIVLSIALPTEHINIVEILFNLLVSIGYLEFIAIVPSCLLVVIVASGYRLNLSVVKFFVWLSKFTVKALYAVVGFSLALLLANLLYGHMTDAAFFAIVSFTTYFVALAVHWMLLDLESQSIALSITASS